MGLVPQAQAKKKQKKKTHKINIRRRQEMVAHHAGKPKKELGGWVISQLSVGPNR
jgi:hypothetical protein